MSSFRLRVACLPWWRLPAPLFFLVGSPVLRWCFGSGAWFVWPAPAPSSAYADAVLAEIERGAE